MSVGSMVGFGHKQAWLAVRGGDPMTLVNALGLRDLGEVGWRSGIDLAYLTDDRLVMTPLLAGARDSQWLLATGRWLLSATFNVGVTQMSTNIGTEVQFFATYRVTEAHRWERAVDGTLIRAFSYLGESGEIIDWRGDPDQAELDIGLPPWPDPDADILVSESDVLRLAGAWSVDPTSLDGRPASGPLRVAAAP
jgi:hypothetical protein